MEQSTQRHPLLKRGLEVIRLEQIRSRQIDRLAE